MPANRPSPALVSYSNKEHATGSRWVATWEAHSTHDDPQAFLQSGPGQSLSEQDIREKIAARLDARRQKNYAEADRIRAELESAGVILEDGPQGTTWRRA